MSNEELDDNKLRDDKNYQDKMRIFFSMKKIIILKKATNNNNELKRKNID